jgi:hypothetical protein
MHNKGWSEEGVQRFNILLDKVRKDRKENSKWFDDEIEKQLLKDNKDTDDEGNEHDKENNNWIRADNDLFDDEAPPFLDETMEVTQYETI